MALKRRYDYNGEQIYNEPGLLITGTVSSPTNPSSLPQQAEITNITRRLSAQCPVELAALSEPSLSANYLISSTVKPPDKLIIDEQAKVLLNKFLRSSADDNDGCRTTGQNSCMVEVSNLCDGDQVANGKIKECFVQTFYDGLEKNIFNVLSSLISVPKYTSLQTLNGDVLKDNGDYPSHLLPISELQHQSYELMNKVLKAATPNGKSSFASYFFYANQQRQISKGVCDPLSALNDSETPLLTEKGYITDNAFDFPVCLFEPSLNSLRLSIKFCFKCEVQAELCRRYCRASHFNNSCTTIAELGLHKLLRKQALRGYDISFLITDWHVSAQARSSDALSRTYSLANSSTAVNTCRVRGTLEKNEAIDAWTSSREIAKNIVDYMRSIEKTAEGMVKTIDENATYMADSFVQKIDAINKNSSSLRTRKKKNNRQNDLQCNYPPSRNLPLDSTSNVS